MRNMKDIHWLVVLVLAIAVLLLAYNWFVEPYNSQRKMIEYDQEQINTSVGFMSDVLCPYGDHGDNIEHTACVEQDIVDHRLDGGRIKLVQVYYCKTHYIQFSVVLIE